MPCCITYKRIRYAAGRIFSCHISPAVKRFQIIVSHLLYTNTCSQLSARNGVSPDKRGCGCPLVTTVQRHRGCSPPRLRSVCTYCPSSGSLRSFAPGGNCRQPPVISLSARRSVLPAVYQPNRVYRNMSFVFGFDSAACGGTSVLLPSVPAGCISVGVRRVMRCRMWLRHSPAAAVGEGRIFSVINDVSAEAATKQTVFSSCVWGCAKYARFSRYSDKFVTGAESIARAKTR